LEAAAEAANTCDVFFSIGTSGLVEPAASLARLALQHGAAVLEVNPTETPLTSRATYVLTGASGAILPVLVKAVW
jgi:NAD-dependent deacetylase